MEETLIISGVKCIVKDSCVVVKQSHLISYEDIHPFCVKLKASLSNLPFKRSADSWTVEIVAHNVLYELGLSKIRTQDADLDEHESWYRLLCYSIIYNIIELHRWIKRKPAAM